MNILYFTQYFPPEIGAAPGRAFCHARKWCAMGHRVTVITNVPNSPFGKFYGGYRNKLMQKEEIDGIQVIRVFTFRSGKSSNVLFRFLGSFLYVLMSRWAYRHEQPDIVLGSAPFFAGFAASRAARRKNVPLVYELRDPWLQVVGHTLGKGRVVLKRLHRLERKIMHNAHRVVVIGKQMSRYVQEQYQLPEPPEVIYNGIVNADFEALDPASPAPLPESITLNRDRFKIGFIGNLGNQYRIDLVLDTAALLQEQGQAIDFILVGEGARKDQVKKRVKELGLDNVHLFDAVPYRLSLDLLTHMDLSIIPLKEGDIYDLYLPLKLFESLALAVPPILCGGKEAGTIVKEAGAGVFIPGTEADPQRLTSIILDYATNRDKVLEQGKRGRQFILENFNREKMAKQYIDIFKSLTAGE